MYWHVEIPIEYTDVTVPKTSGVNASYDAVHEFIANAVIPRINASLLDLYKSQTDAPLVELVYEKHSPLSEMSATGGFYIYDFFIRMMNQYEEKRSHGYRIRISAKNGSGGEIGVRAGSSAKKSWQGEIIHTSGKSGFVSDYTISNVTVMPRRQNLVSGSGIRRAWGEFSYILTERAFLLFTSRGKQPMNIVSFISTEDLLKERDFMWMSNGWRDSVTIDEKTKRDLYRTQTISLSPSGKIRLYEYIVQDTLKVDKWFVPDIYVTSENRTNNHSEYLIQHNNLSIGETVQYEGICCLINTLPIGSNRMAVVI